VLRSGHGSGRAEEGEFHLHGSVECDPGEGVERPHSEIRRGATGPIDVDQARLTARRAVRGSQEAAKSDGL
jgi:hypothetical protein